MSDKFKEAIKKFREAEKNSKDKEGLIKASHNIFLSMRSMTLEELITMKYSLDVFQSTTNMNEVDVEIVKYFNHFILKRSRALYLKLCKDADAIKHCLKRIMEIFDEEELIGSKEILEEKI